MGRGHQDVTVDLTHKVDPSIRGSSPATPILGMCAPLALSTLEAAQGESLEIVIWC